MEAYCQIGIQALIPAVLTFVFFFLEKHTIVKEQLPYPVRQGVYGVAFGLVGIYCTENGIDYNGAVINARDAAIVTAGLLFGAPAGIISGIIAGYERWMAVAWGVGTYTRVACTVSTIVAGFYSGLLRKYLFDDEKPNWGLAFAIGLVIEVFHMIMVFVTNMDDTARAAEVVKTCSVIMVPANALGVMVSAMFDTFATTGKLFQKRTLSSIAEKIQKWLLAAVVFIFLVTSIFIYNLQTSIAEKQAQNYLSLAISDVASDIETKSNSNLLNNCYKIRNLLNDTNINEIANTFDVAEINVVDKNGIIVDCNNSEYLGFDMNSGEQSREFLCLLEDTVEYVQEYGPISYDKNTYRKYAGIKTNDGFIQVSYDAGRFQTELASEIKTIALNRHVGNTGYVIIADKDRWIVSQPDNVKINKLDDFGFNKKNVDSFFKAKVNEEACLCYCQSVEGYYIISIMPEKEAYSLRDTAIYANTFIEILAFAALFGMIYQLVRNVIVKKVGKINKSLGKITDGNLDEVINVRNTVEFDSLSNDINSTVDTLKNYIAEASARIDAELEYAKNIQNSALPHYFPNNEHFEIYALMDAAKEVGGDFYDFSRLDKDTFNFLVADVSGKGIPGAMFMMRAKSVLSAFTEMREEVNDIFTKGNEKLCEGNDAGMFVTSWEASLDIPTGHIKYANAGHNPPVVRRADGTVEFIKGRPGFVLAGMEGIQYKVQELDLKPGDIIFLYTDGVVEATNLNKELYGDDRLIEAMKRLEFETMEELCNKLLGEVNRFVGDAEQFDDITMLAVKYLG